jgi:hypothetical protein
MVKLQGEAAIYARFELDFEGYIRQSKDSLAGIDRQIL